MNRRKGLFCVSASTWRVYASENRLMLCISPSSLSPFSVHNVAEAPGATLELQRPHHAQPSTHERGELKTFLFLIQLDYWQAVDAENGGDFAAVMDVMFEYMPDDPLERNCGPHFSRQACCIHPHVSEWLERRLYQFRVPHTFRIIQRREDLLKVSRSQVGQRLLDQLPGLLKSGNQFCRRVEWIHARLTDSESP